MNVAYAWDDAFALLRRRGIKIEPGLDRREIASIEGFLGACLPPDLASFLATGLPVGERFPNWRQLDALQIAGEVDSPLDGILFDIENNAFWLPSWGSRPSRLHEALTMAEVVIKRAPPLIRIYAHRYLPSAPSEPGNPVLSVHQTDVIFYGRNLPSYFAIEFGGQPWKDHAVGNNRHLPFWGEIVS